jgi:predicted MFS family arabinose efflux permease
MNMTVDPRVVARRAAARTWRTAVGLSLGAAVAAGYARFAYGLILPAMRADLGWTYAEAGWINTANALGYLLGSALTLATIRRLGPRQLFVAGLVFTTLSLVMTGLAANLWILSFWRLAAGVGGAPVFIAGGALAAGLFRGDPTRNATSISLFFGGGGFGVLLSGLLLPGFFEHFGVAAWREAWFALAALALLSSAASLASVHAAGPALTVPISPNVSTSEPLPIARMWPSLLGYAMFALGYIVYFTFLVAWMRARSVPTSGVVVTWSLLGLGAMLGPLPWRRVLAASDTGLPLALANAATGFAAALPLIWSSPTGFATSAFLFGLSFFNAPTAVTNFSRKNLEQKYWGQSVALYTTVFAIGQILGPVGAGWLTDATGELAWGFAIAAAVLIGGAAIAAGQRALPRAGAGPPR